MEEDFVDFVGLLDAIEVWALVLEDVLEDIDVEVVELLTNAKLLLFLVLLLLFLLLTLVEL